ncbi:hypothetical protein [Glycomyces buryatensis]|uniref:Uncharacterized protein n=1 Tax=Glycomyces buryatensis TaxID=2570927 RepID=A0A4S8QDP6_9ACTN|nr:hypothetical protein [Glycomyces buryatensis]THV42683.1 hypothetical protein FAB82_05835 [Glycomyces buryatensis]
MDASSVVHAAVKPPDRFAGAGELIPSRMDLAVEWDTPERINFELWVDSEVGDGIILAICDGPAEIGGDVQIAGDQMCVTWRGALSDRPRAWLNAQRARAGRLYFGHRP